jgi:beta-xylosidase
MKCIHEGNWRGPTPILLISVAGTVLLLGFTASAGRAAGKAGGTDRSIESWLAPQNWRRDSDQPALSLGEKGTFDDQHIFAPHVIQQDGEFWMYYSGSQRCVDAGTYKGVAKDPEHPEKSDQRLFKLGLAKSTDGVHFTRVSRDPVFSFGDDIHSVVTAAILKNPDGSVHREDGKLRMYFAAVDFPRGTYKHDLYETTSSDGIHWAKPTFVMANAYAPCVIKEGDKYRMWYTWIDRHPWHTNHAESDDGTHWKITEKPCIVMDQKWEVKDQVYPMVIKADGVYLMMYGCYWSDDKHTALGFAVSRDGLTWTKHPDNPVFRPEPKHDWESNFTTSHTLIRLSDGSFRLWYAGRRQPPWSNLYFAIGTARWEGPGK